MSHEQETRFPLNPWCWQFKFCLVPVLSNQSEKPWRSRIRTLNYSDQFWLRTCDWLHADGIASPRLFCLLLAIPSVTCFGTGHHWAAIASQHMLIRPFHTYKRSMAALSCYQLCFDRPLRMPSSICQSHSATLAPPQYQPHPLNWGGLQSQVFGHDISYLS